MAGLGDRLEGNHPAGPRGDNASFAARSAFKGVKGQPWAACSCPWRPWRPPTARRTGR